MKILATGLWNFQQGGGGLDRYFFDYISSSTESIKGYVRGNSDEVMYCGKSRIETIFGNGFSFWKLYHRKVKEFLKSNKVDVYNPHFALMAVPVIGMAAKGRIPVVMNFQGPWHLELKEEGYSAWKVFLAKQIERYVYRRVDGFIVLSTGFKKILLDTFEVDENNVHVIPPGVDLARFSLPKQPVEELRSQWGLDPDDFVVFSVRRLRHRMGLEHLVTAVGNLPSQKRPVKLLLAGSGPLLPDLKNIAAHTANPKACQFLGRVTDDELVALYQLADLTVMPSVALEGFGLIAIESLSCGTPVLMSRIGGSAEVLEALDSRLIVDDINAESLGDRLQKLIQNPELLPTAEKCRDFAEEHFDWQQIADHVEKVFSKTSPKRRIKHSIGIF